MTVDGEFDVTETGTVEQNVVDLTAFRARRDAHVDAQCAKANDVFDEKRYAYVEACRDHLSKAIEELFAQGMPLDAVATAAIAAGGAALSVAHQAGIMCTESVKLQIAKVAQHVLDKTPPPRRAT